MNNFLYIFPAVSGTLFSFSYCGFDRELETISFLRYADDYNLTAFDNYNLSAPDYYNNNAVDYYNFTTFDY